MRLISNKRSFQASLMNLKLNKNKRSLRATAL